MVKKVNMPMYSSEKIMDVRLTDSQRNLIENLLVELGALEQKLNSKVDEGIDSRIFLVPLLWLEGLNSSLIEGTATTVDGLSYDIDGLDDIKSWEHRNIINMYEEYFKKTNQNNFLNSHINNFRFEKDEIGYMHRNMYRYTSEGKFKLNMNPNKYLEKIKPGKFIINENNQNYSGIHHLGIENASLIYLDPKLKEKYLIDLLATIQNKIDNNTLIIDDVVKMHPIFEAIHPFADGNGRLGRLLLSILFAKWKPNINIPIHLSEQFFISRERYIALIREIQINGSNYKAWKDWNMFFVGSLLNYKKITEKRINKIIYLWDSYSCHNEIKGNEKRKKILALFFKYLNINKKYSIDKLNTNYEYAKSTLYTDFNKVIDIIGAKENNGYFRFDELLKALIKIN